jgi:hypothetical protein
MPEPQISSKLVSDNSPSKSRPMNWSNMLTYVSVVIIVATEALVLAFASAWAIGGLFELDGTIKIVLYVTFAFGGAWATYLFARRAYGVDDKLAADKHRSPRRN